MHFGMNLYFCTVEAKYNSVQFHIVEVNYCLNCYRSIETTILILTAKTQQSLAYSKFVHHAYLRSHQQYIPVAL